MDSTDLKKKISWFVFFVIIITGISLTGHFWPKEINRSAREGIGAQVSGGSIELLADDTASDARIMDNSSVEGESESMYRHPSGAFSFHYPHDFRINSTPYEKNGEVITFEKDDDTGFQIFLSPFDEEGPLTKERILQDLDITMQNPREIEIDSVPAISFNGNEESVGETYEVWFVHEGYLYQITAYVGFQEGIRKILGTWGFQ